MNMRSVIFDFVGSVKRCRNGKTRCATEPFASDKDEGHENVGLDEASRSVGVEPFDERLERRPSFHGGCGSF